MRSYYDFSAFKLYANDVGLLGAMSELSPSVIMDGNSLFTNFKGALTEQYVLQELEALGLQPYYHSKDNSSLELDFIIQKDEVYPIEVKAEENLRSKSLRAVYEENNALKPVRFSMSGYREQNWMKNVPLYLAGEWCRASE